MKKMQNSIKTGFEETVVVEETEKIVVTSYRGFVSIDQEMERSILSSGKGRCSEIPKNNYYGKGSL